MHITERKVDMGAYIAYIVIVKITEEIFPIQIVSPNKNSMATPLSLVYYHCQIVFIIIKMPHNYRRSFRDRNNTSDNISIVNSEIMATNNISCSIQIIVVGFYMVKPSYISIIAIIMQLH